MLELLKVPYFKITFYFLGFNFYWISLFPQQSQVAGREYTNIKYTTGLDQRNSMSRSFTAPVHPPPPEPPKNKALPR